MGVQHRLLEFTAGYGFHQIAVSLMDATIRSASFLPPSCSACCIRADGARVRATRDHPRHDRHQIAGLVILFAGALDGAFKNRWAQALRRLKGA
jgi:ABC-type uncharacterized transport system permease subunit